jgi:threonine/homoserine/homoserine lactone efflux protein
MTSSLLNSHLLLTFAMTAAVIVVVPGPSVMFIVSRALTVGRPAAMAAAAGNTAGTVVQGLLAAIGVGSLVAESEMVFTIIKWFGAMYLVAMGSQTLRHRKESSEAQDAGVEQSRRTVARQGFMVGVTNPKMVVFFSAALPQFVDRERGYVVVQMLVLLAIWGVLSIVSDSSWGFAGGSLRKWSVNAPKRVERMIGLGGACVIVVGLVLALSHSGS